ncbi:MAG: hypothetical protein EAZ92_04075 [Candidatus Kapaibacterium sp.]|nr:MAG: hypothetical protein EAZ92_04075 [Candidatus Kapabacteria bacterium]
MAKQQPSRTAKTPQKAAAAPQNKPKKIVQPVVRDTPIWWDVLEQKLSFTFSPFLIALVLNAALFAVFYKLFHPEFNTGDDRAMMLLAAGKLITLAPTEYLIFINILIGHCLKWLYTSFPGTSWYPIMLIAALFGGYTALCYAALKRRPSIMTVLLYIIMFFALGGYTLAELQFTMSATILAFGGIALVLVQGKGEETENTENAFHIVKHRIFSGAGLVGIVLLTLAAMLRWQSFTLVLACTVPLFIVPIFFTRTRQMTLAACLLLGCAGLLAGGAEAYHRYRYANWGSFNYLEFNRVYGMFSDVKKHQRVPFSSLEQYTSMAQQAANWTASDFEMLLNEFYMDETLYTSEKMQKVLDAFDKFEREEVINPAGKNYEIGKDNFAEMNKKLWQRQWQLFRSDGFAMAALILLATLCIAEFELVWLCTVIAAGGVLFGLLFYINDQTLMRDVAERVYFPLWIYCAMLGLLITKARAKRMETRSQAILLTACACAAVGLAGFAVWKTKGSVEQYAGISDFIKDGEKQLRQTIATLQPKKENLYVIWGYGFPFRDMPPFCDVNVFNNFHALWLMWAQRTPTTKELLQAHKVTNIYHDLPRRQDICFILGQYQVSNNLLNYPFRFGRFLTEHENTMLTLRKDGKKYITNVQEKEKGNIYTTFLTFAIDTLTATEVAYYRQQEALQQAAQQQAAQQQK